MSFFQHAYVHLRAAWTHHWGMIVASGVLAFLMILPLLLFPVIAGSMYQGINIADHGIDELLYLSRGKEALEGHGMGDALQREAKDVVDQHFSIFEEILVTPWRLVGLASYIHIPLLYAIYNFFAVGLLLLLIYFFVLRLGSDRYMAAGAALMAVGGYAVLSPNLLFGINVYSRAFSPTIPAVFVFLYLICLLQSIERDTRPPAAAAGLLFGLLFYVYFYAWSFLLVFNVFFIAVHAMKKHWNIVRRCIGITALGISIGAYTLFQMWQYAHSPAGVRAEFFHWVVHDHRLYASRLLVALAALCAYVVWKKRHREYADVFIAFVGASWVVMNQQILTGQELQTGHYLLSFVFPGAIIAGVYAAWSVLPEGVWKKAFFVFFIAFSVANTAIGQYRASLTNLSLKLHRQEYRPILDALKQEKNSGVVLAADDQDAYLVTIYTPHDLFWAYGFGFFNVPETKAIDALFVYIYLNKHSREHFVSYLGTALARPSASSIYGNSQWFYTGMYQAIEGLLSGLDFQEYHDRADRNDPTVLRQREILLPELAQKYSRVANPDAMRHVLWRSGVTHMIWDRTKNPEWDLGFLDKTLLAEHDDIFLYRLNISPQ